MSSTMVNRLREGRGQRGWSQEELARRAGLSRAEISAIETRRVVPSTAAALSLAAALGLRVEDLFSLGGAAGAEEAAWEATARPARYWLAAVGGRLLRYPVESTAVGVLPHDGVEESREPSADPRRTVVVAGCDPAVGILASELLRQRGWRLLPLLRPSGAALDLLATGSVHFAGIHLGDNAAAARERLRGGFRLARLAEWEAGIATSGPGYRTVRAVVRSRARWVNRPAGSGARRLFNEIFRDVRRPPAGRGREVGSHAAVAEVLRSGMADAGICPRLAAEQAGLQFLPVRRESYELCTTTALEEDPAVWTLVDVIRSTAFRRLLADLPGYRTETTGEFTAALPGGCP